MIGQQVYLRPVKKEDMKSFHQATMDEDIRYMTGTKKTFTLEQLNDHFEKISKDPTRYDFSICLTNSHEIIGDTSILDIDFDNYKAAFRIALHNQKYLNRGFGTEAVQLSIQFVFEKLNLNRLELEVFSHNPRAIKVYEKLGFKKEGVLREALYYNEQYSDEIIMGILKKDYLSKISN